MQVSESMHTFNQIPFQLEPKVIYFSFFSDLGEEQSLVLKVVLTLTDCPVSCHQLLNDEQNIVLDLCTSCLVLEHHAATSKALEILTKLVAYCYTERIPPPINYVNQIDLHIESLIYVSMVDMNLEKELKSYLKCGVNLSQYNQDFRDRFLDIVGSLLTDNFGMSFLRQICAIFIPLNNLELITFFYPE